MTTDTFTTSTLTAGAGARSAGPLAAAPVTRVAAWLDRWRADGLACALARVVATGGSAPLSPGTAMAVAATGEVAGGVSGGCVDAAVYSLCEQVIADGRPVLARFGPDGDELLGSGPTCGGTIEVLVEPLAARHPVDRLLAAARGGRAAVAATVLDGPGIGRWEVACGDLLDDANLFDDDDDDNDDAPPRPGGPVTAAVSGARGTGIVETLLDGRPTRVFVHRIEAPRLLVFGANAFAEALAPLGAQLGYRVTVVDARPVFAGADRFPAAAEVVRCWPHDYLARTRVEDSTAICVLTHDAKFDLPLLEEALRTRAGYIGAMGSRRTHVSRLADLRARGVGESDLRRLRSPLGLDLGACTAAETALSIAAELVACRRGGTGAPLVGLDAAIHR